MIIGVFVLSWLVSTVFYKVKRYDRLNVREAPNVRTDPVSDRVVKEEILSSRRI